MSIPESVGYGRVIGTLISAAGDGSDEDSYPDGVALPGLTVRFSASVQRVRVASPPTIIVLNTITCTTDSNGTLLDPDGNPGVWLVASTDPDTDPTGWTWTATISASASDVFIAGFSTTFSLDVGQTLDLASLIPVPSSPGTELAAWQQVVAQITGEFQSLVDEAQEAAETATAMAGQTVALQDAAVQSLIMDEASATRAALEQATAPTEQQVLTLVSEPGPVKDQLSATIAQALSYIYPSGDETGETDSSAIETAIGQGNTKIVLRGTPGQRFYINRPITLYSRTTVVLWDAYVRLTDGANCSLIRNHWAMPESGGGFGEEPDTMMRVYGIGLARLDGNPTKQTLNIPSDDYTRYGVFFCNAYDVIVDSVTIGPTRIMAGVTHGVTKMHWNNIELAQDESTPNQDGLDVGPGCHDILMTNTHGRSGDDFHSVWSKIGASGTASGNQSPWTVAAWTENPDNLSSDNIVFINSKADYVGQSLLRCQAGDGATLRDVKMVSPRVQSMPHGYVLALGSLGYVTTPPTQDQFQRISVTDFEGDCAASMLGMDSNATDIKVTGRITGKFNSIFGHAATVPTTISRVTVDVETTDLTGIRNNHGIVARAGDVWDQIKLTARFAGVGRLMSYLSQPAPTITNLDMDVDVLATNQTLFPQGWVGSGSLKLNRHSVLPIIRDFNTVLPLKILDPAPILTTRDMIPSPIVGSQMLARGDLDTSLGGNGNGALYVGNGSSWSRGMEIPGLGTKPPRINVIAPDTTIPAGATTATITSGTGLSVGDLAVLVLAADTGLASVTDNNGNNPWTIAKVQTGNGLAVSIAYSILTNGITSVTATLNGSTARSGAMYLATWIGTSGNLDKTSGITGGAGVNLMADPVVTTAANELALFAVAYPTVAGANATNHFGTSPLKNNQTNQISLHVSGILILQPQKFAPGVNLSAETSAYVGAIATFS